MRQTQRLLLASCLLFASAACNKAATKPAPPPPPAVKVAEAVIRDVPIYVEAVGQTRGNKEIEISARVEGFLETMNFKEGTFVKKGQVLYTIDSRPFRANLAQSQASFAQSEAELVRKHQDVVRYEPLVAKNAVSVQEYETAVAQEKARKSAVAAAKASADRAQIRARLHDRAGSRRRPHRRHERASGHAGRPRYHDRAHAHVEGRSHRRALQHLGARLPRLRQTARGTHGRAGVTGANEPPAGGSPSSSSSPTARRTPTTAR